MTRNAPADDRLIPGPPLSRRWGWPTHVAKARAKRSSRTRALRQAKENQR